MRDTAFGIVADGADAVRKAARHNLRDGSDFIKIHVSGGVATPSDPLESTQYTAEEVQAAVVEAKHRQTYVAAHAYTPEAVLLAVENGVHSIEHGNLIDKAAATMMAASGSILVPTLSTYEAMAELGAALNLPQSNQDKNKTVYERGLASLELAREAGVTLGFGTDLIGETQVRQGREFAIRAEVEPARDILRSMYLINPRLCMMEGEIGVLAPGSVGDMVLCKINPLENIALLANPADSLTLVLQSGMPVSGDSAS
jgi:imidazolonepropionase-like amidohydrolase